jgi:hypothetical protein
MVDDERDSRQGQSDLLLPDLDPSADPYLLLGVEERDLTDLSQVEPNRILSAFSGRGLARLLQLIPSVQGQGALRTEPFGIDIVGSLRE